MKLLFLDTETTGLSEADQLIQVAYVNSIFDSKWIKGEPVNEYFKPSVEINLQAMSIHHITEEMVKDKPLFENSDVQKSLCEKMHDHIVVAHNAPFDIRVLKKAGVTVFRYIDTLQVAKHVFPDLPCYTMQYLKYYTKCYLQIGNDHAKAHDALGDINVLYQLFLHIHYNFIKGDSVEAKINSMIELSTKPITLKTFSFGKYKDRLIEDVRKIDIGYLRWLYDSETQKLLNEQNTDLVYTLEQIVKN